MSQGAADPGGADERVLLGLGSNLGDRRGSIDEAVRQVGRIDGVEVVACSRLVETRPVGGPPQGPFLNAAVELRSRLGPLELLRRLLDVERALGRERRVRWGPRTIDIDLLLFGVRQVETPELAVPHPRMLERAFVLEPLAEIAGDARHPGTGRTVEEHRRELAGGRTPCE